MSNDRKVAIAELVCRALADLRDPQGSTEKQIREYIQANYKIPDVAIKQYIATALKTGVAFGLISKKRGHYQLTTLVDNIRVIAQRRSKRKAPNKLPVRRIRTPAIRKTATKTRPSTRRRPKTDTNYNKKSNKNYKVRFCDDDDDPQEQNASDDYDEENVQQDDNESHDNGVIDGEYDNDELTDNDEEMEADDQEEYDDDDDESNDDANADEQI